MAEEFKLLDTILQHMFLSGKMSIEAQVRFREGFDSLTSLSEALRKCFRNAFRRNLSKDTSEVDMARRNHVT